MTPQEKLAAKRANEGTKFFATLLNTLSAGTFIAGFLSPLVSGRSLPLLADVALIVTSFALHILTQTIVRLFLKSEE